MRSVRYRARCLLCAVLASGWVLGTSAIAAPKVVVISLDGATPRNIERFLRDGTLSKKRGLGLLIKHGLMAKRNVTVTPSLTAPAHIAIATGSTAAKNDILANGFHLIASPFARNISGFSAPIGGYRFSPHGSEESPDPTAEPLWVALRAAGKKVVTATFPGGDGLDVRVPGLVDSPIVQPASLRTVDYTVPFGAFAGLGARGFELSGLDFDLAPQSTVDQVRAVGRLSFSPVRQKTTTLETFTVGGVNYDIRVAVLDTSNDNEVTYDTLVFFDQTQGILPGPYSLPSTGAAFVQASERRSGPFYLEGSSNQAGTAFYVAQLAPDLSSVRIARYAANFIPRNAPVLPDVDDINSHVGFWAPQPDFRIPERLSLGFAGFPDLELEAIYQDQVRSFVDYQTRLALRSIAKNRDADLVMIYIEQPDGSGHQFLITDPRQATNPLDASSIGPNQDRGKIRRYREYLRRAYQAADDAVQRIIGAAGQEPDGRPRSNIIVVSDHGFAPFHTAVNINHLLAGRGLDPAKVRAVTSGPAVNVYINLLGREPDGIVSREEYISLQHRIAGIFAQSTDPNPNYALGAGSRIVFEKVYHRPLPTDITDPSFGLGTDEFIGQDGGDVFALLNIGYNFDGTQSPVVQRLGDAIVTAPVFSVPNFYGAHGYNPKRRSMSAIFIASGPDVRVGVIERARNIDVAPTVLKLLGVDGSEKIEGKALPVLR
ncbi:MAG: alkaline phosphatase family protein [Gammaproteobacteria bacterium]